MDLLELIGIGHNLPYSWEAHRRGVLERLLYVLFILSFILCSILGFTRHWVQLAIAA